MGLCRFDSLGPFHPRRRLRTHEVVRLKSDGESHLTSSSSGRLVYANYLPVGTHKHFGPARNVLGEGQRQGQFQIHARGEIVIGLNK
jgi:hypothetical protein